MTERPFIAKPHEVRAILAGRQTQFRRVVRPVGRDGGFVIFEQESGAWWPYRSDDGESMFVTIRERGKEFQHEIPMSCPYGKSGDRLWLREAWAYSTHAMAAQRQEDGPFVYAATSHNTQGRLCDRWRPSIHMPRWASRITLGVTGVRVERLQDISEADAVAEGLAQMTGEQLWCADVPAHIPAMWETDPRQAYRTLWESINGPGSWDANPWVWVVQFKRVEVRNG